MRNFLILTLLILSLNSCGSLPFSRAPQQQRINPNQIPGLPQIGNPGQFAPPAIPRAPQPQQGARAGSPFPPSPIPQYNPYAPYGSPAGNYGFPQQPQPQYSAPRQQQQFGGQFQPQQQQPNFAIPQQPQYPQQNYGRGLAPNSSSYPGPQQAPRFGRAPSSINPNYQQQNYPPQQYQQPQYAQGDQNLNRRFAAANNNVALQNDGSKFSLNNSSRQKFGLESENTFSPNMNPPENNFKKKRDFQYRSRYKIQAEGNLPQQNWSSPLQQKAPTNSRDELLFNLNNSNLNNMIDSNQIPQTNTLIQ